LIKGTRAVQQAGCPCAQKCVGGWVHAQKDRSSINGASVEHRNNWVNEKVEVIELSDEYGCVRQKLVSCWREQSARFFNAARRNSAESEVPFDCKHFDDAHFVSPVWRSVGLVWWWVMVVVGVVLVVAVVVVGFVVVTSGERVSGIVTGVQTPS
jgi:hypothetical protein